MTSRTCTILFTDLVGSTELRAQLGDDTFDARRRDHDRLLLDALGRHGGELVKHEGDGVMAVFASAADALSCAEMMQRSLERERGRTDVPLVARVGVSAGDVVEEDDDFHGTPVVEAARLCNSARGGQVLVADVVRVLAGTRGGHELSLVGELELKGLAHPVTAWELEWSRAGAGADVPPRLRDVGARGACVGRDRELDAVVTVWKEAVAGQRRLVLLVGEPGIGKTRLSAELAARVTDHGGVALYGWCDEDLGSPYEPWVQALGGYVRSCSDADLTAVAGDALSELARLLPEVAGRISDAAPSVTVDAEAERARLFDALDIFTEHISTATPLLIVLDDLQWADQPTLALLRRLLRSDRPGALLLLATYRDTDVDRRHPLSNLLADLRREPRVTRVDLGGLDRMGLGAMLADRAGHEAPPDFVRVLHDQTEGNPFFAEEVVTHLAETGVIYQRDGVWTSDLVPADIGLPEGVRDVVGRRLSGLSDTANDLLTVAAVIGREFDAATVIAASGIDRDLALDSLELALSTGLVTEVPRTPGRFAFSHALVRQTLFEEIRGPRRARLHWRVGEALAMTHDPPLAAVAFHLCEGVLAGDAEQAALAAVEAAEEAARIGAPEDARALAQRALEVLDDANVEQPQQRCRALLVFGEAAARESQEWGASRERVRGAANLAHEHCWPDLAVRAAIAYSHLSTPGVLDPTSRALAEAALELGADAAHRPALVAIVGMAHAAQGDWEQGSALIDEALAAVGDATPLAQVQVFGSSAGLQSGSPDVTPYAAATEVLLAAAESAQSAWAEVLARLHRAAYALRVGDRAAFEAERAAVAAVAAGGGSGPVSRMLDASAALLDARFHDAERIALEQLSTIDPVSINALNSTAQLAAAWFWTGRDEDLLAGLDALPAEQRPQRVISETVRVSTRARRGERDPHFDVLAADDFAGLPSGFLFPGMLCHVGYTAAWLDDRERARVLEPMLAAYAGQLLVSPMGALVFEPADSVRGMLLMTLDRPAEAVVAFEAAAALCERAGDVTHGVMNAHRLAAAVLARNEVGDLERARDLATDALAEASDLGMAPDVGFAEAVLQRVN